MKTSIYLRKSRADRELETLGEGNTLNRHKETLLKLANEKNMNIIKTYEEIVSGEKISARPEMQKLIADVKKGTYDAVLVMDLDRLGRGNMQEQGLILDTFKESGTKIITPLKTYDLDNEFDEEYSEFEAFMARKELKIITRRMQRGRLKSIEEGNYISPIPPFGYKIIKQNRCRSLVPDEETAPIVRIIFRLYSRGMGGSKIANHLNSMGFKTATGKTFSSGTIINIINNPVYSGNLRWNSKSSKVSVYKGNHTPLINQKIYCAALNQLKNKSHPCSKKYVANPFAGLIFCGCCGKTMKYKKYSGNQRPRILCDNPLCHMNKSAFFDEVENKIMCLLESSLINYNRYLNISRDNNFNYKNLSTMLNKELEQLLLQSNKINELLEDGIYDTETYLRRKSIAEGKIAALKKEICSIKKYDYSKNPLKNQLKFSDVIILYKKCTDNSLKNQLLKSFIYKIVYYRPKDMTVQDFAVEIHLKV